MRVVRAFALALTVAMLPLSASSLPFTERAWAAGVGTQAVVAQEAVVAKPYDLALAPDGEFRILHFNAGLVNSVLVAKPWLLTVLIQGNDVVLQAKASGGTTQLVAYVGDAGTLWQVEIAAHPSAPTRIVVKAPGEEPPAQATPPPGRPVAPNVQPSAVRDTRLTAFLGTLTPVQRAGFEMWQRSPTAAALADWLSGLSPEQQAAFQTLVQAHVVTVPSPLGPTTSRPSAPPLVDTTTVIGRPQAPAQATTTPASRTSAAAPVAVPAAANALHVDVANVPKGVTVTASATQTADRVDVQYTIHNGLEASLADPRVVATDALGHAATVSGVPTGAIAPGHDASGTITVQATKFPVVLRWTWDQRAIQKAWFISGTVSRGLASFDIAITP